MTRECGCRINWEDPNHNIIHCPKHASADKLIEAADNLLDAMGRIGVSEDLGIWERDMKDALAAATRTEGGGE